MWSIGSRISSLLPAALGVCTLAFGPPALAKAPDPCATPGLDFPAFAFWRKEGGKEQIYVADAKAKCIRPVTRPTHAYVMQLSFPVAGTTDRGRLAWVEAPAVVTLDFTVSAATRQLTVHPKKVAYTGTGGYISLSTDGLTLYSTHYPVEGGVVIDRQALDATGSPVGSAVTVFQTPPGNGIAGISVNGPQTVIYADFRPAPRATTPFQLVWIPLDGSNVVNPIESNADRKDLSPAAHPTLDLVVYDRDIPAAQVTKGCDPLVIKDIGGATANYPAEPAFGFKPTWMNGKVLADGRTKPSRSKTCGYSGTIMQLDLATGVQSPLVSGYDPDGR